MCSLFIDFYVRHTMTYGEGRVILPFSYLLTLGSNSTDFLYKYISLSHLYKYTLQHYKNIHFRFFFFFFVFCLFCLRFFLKAFANLIAVIFDIIYLQYPVRYNTNKR